MSNNKERFFFVAWDHRVQPEEEELNSALNEFGVYAKYVDTGSDTFVLALSKEPFTQKQGDKAWKEVWE